jgi:hypothetical protein
MIRQYERVSAESTESVLVHIDTNNRVKMTADNMHELLLHLGYQRTDVKENA